MLMKLVPTGASLKYMPLNNEVAFKPSACCYAQVIYIDTWHHSLSSKMRLISQNLARHVYRHYRQYEEGEYHVISASGYNYWMIGVCTELPCSMLKQHPEIHESKRKLRRNQCEDSIALIIEYELGRMPVALTTGIK